MTDDDRMAVIRRWTITQWREPDGDTGEDVVYCGVDGPDTDGPVEVVSASQLAGAVEALEALIVAGATAGTSGPEWERERWWRAVAQAQTLIGGQ